MNSDQQQSRFEESNRGAFQNQNAQLTCNLASRFRSALILSVGTILLWLILSGIVSAGIVAQANETISESAAESKMGAESDQPLHFEDQVGSMLERYCLDCHTGEDSEGGVDLEIFLVTGTPDPDQLTAMRRVITDGYMPPSDSEQLELSDRNLLLEWLKKTLVAQAKPAPVMMRRMNRIQFENTLKDLLRIDVDVFRNPQRILMNEDYFQPPTRRMPNYVLALSYFSYAQQNGPAMPNIVSLPSDAPVEHGFNNHQRALSLSPMLLEQYFDSVVSIIENEEFHRSSRLWRSMFVCDSSSNEVAIKRAHQRLGSFLPRAFRRPVTNEELVRYWDLFDSEFQESGYTQAMKTTVSAILISPNFLFRDEFSKTTSVVSHSTGPVESDLVDDYQLASRLSYFLWNSMPDEILLNAAAEGRLNDPLELETQVRRMLLSSKIKSLSTDFGMQWLRTQKVLSAQPDSEKYREFYQGKGQIPPPSISMMIEQLLLFETVMIEDRSILEFIQTDIGYLNRNLMDWYKFRAEKLVGFRPRLRNYEDFFRVQWPNTHRGGVITSGAMLTGTSATTRTSPVYRGNWILDVIFNRPPPPAPANVPPLDEGGSDDADLNVRLKLEQHRKDKACAACHDRIDPLGLALENFDAVGRFRRNYENGDEVDSSGEVNGQEFEGASRFKGAILKKPEPFVRAFVEHLMKYALGRSIHISDEPEIERIAKAVVENEYRFSTAIIEVVLSKPFCRILETPLMDDVNNVAEPIGLRERRD